MDRRARLILGALGAVLLLAAGFAGWRLRPPPLEGVRIHRLNFPAGTIETARFAPDGRRIYFSLRAGGKPPEIYVSDPDSAEARALGIKDAILLAVSDREELALLQGAVRRTETMFAGALVVADGSGGARRRVRDSAWSAAWDGRGLDVLREDGTRQSLEFPPGKVLGSWDEVSVTMEHPTLSGDGSILACVLYDNVRATTRVEAFYRGGGRRVLYSREGGGIAGVFTGMAWGPGKELWISELDGDQSTLWALSLGGVRRVLWRGQGNLQLMDVSRGGRALLVQQTAHRRVCGLRAGSPEPVDLSIQGQSQVRGISRDGRSVLLDKSPVRDGGSPMDRWYLRSVDGGPVQALGRGYGMTISPRGDWVQVDPSSVPRQDLPPSWARALEAAPSGGALLFVPAGSGAPFTVPVPAPYEAIHRMAYLMPDGRGVLANASLEGRALWIRLDREGGPPTALTPPGEEWPPVASLDPLSPDGTRMIAAVLGKDERLAWRILSMSGGAPRPVPGLRPGERVVGWTADGASIFVRNGFQELPVTLARVRLATGRRAPAFTFSPLDPAGFLESRDAYVTPDGRACAIFYQENISDFYLADGL